MTENDTTELIDVEELTGSLNYYDELAIEKSWGKPFNDLAGVILLRALLFIQFRRGGLKDKDAFEKAAKLRMDQVDGFFEDVAEGDPEDPVTETGKDDSTPA